MTKQKKLTLDELLLNYGNALREYGLAYTSQLNLLYKANVFVKWLELHGTNHLEDELIAKYFHELDARWYNGDVSKRSNKESHRQVERFLHFCKSGELQLPYPLKGARTELPPKFMSIVHSYLSSGNFHANTVCDMRWITHKYFGWLCEQGFEDLNGVGANQITHFMLYGSQRMSHNSMRNVKLYMGKLYEYLYENGLAESAYRSLFAFKVNRETKVYPPLPKDEIAQMLATIDRSKKRGKRDYAIMLLGTVLGLRACDIVSLKLKDIDWLRGEIRIVQSKTSKTVVLPLTQDVGVALQDYILYGRASTESTKIFLRINAPHKPLATATTIGDIYHDCRLAAGLSANKKFHNLRRTLATSMIGKGATVDTTGQTLGHTSINSLKPYIATDRFHLKMCALPLDGIAPSSGHCSMGGIE